MSTRYPTLKRLLPFLAVLLAGCAAADSRPSASTPAPIPPTPKRTAPAVPEDGVIQLSRSACFGRCPQYRVMIAADGSVSFTGERFVAVTGVQRGTSDPAQLASLRQLLRSAEVRRLKDVYRPGEAGCGVWATDMPTVTIDWTLDGQPHHLQHYLGCSAAPAVLSSIAHSVDAAAQVATWTQQGVIR